MTPPERAAFFSTAPKCVTPMTDQPLDDHAPEPAATPDPSLPKPPSASRERFEATLSATARLSARIAKRVGGAIKRGYHAIDPDVRRHIAHTPLISLTQLGAGDPTPIPQQSDGHRVVLFVHGLGGRPGNFVGLRALFRTIGRTRQYAFPLLKGGDIPEMAQHLAAQINAVIDVNQLGDDEQIDIIAHSMGGIVSRLALTEPSIAARVSTLITLGTPHKGTWLARYADTALTRALRPSSEIMQRLDDQLPWPTPPAAPRLVALWSNADMVLLPHSTGAVPGAENIEIEDASHYSYLLRPAVWRQVFYLLIK